MASKEITAQPAVVDKTGTVLFRDPDMNKIADVLGNRAALGYLASVAKFDQQYQSRKITFKEWQLEVLKLAVDAVVGPGKEADGLKSTFEFASVDPIANLMAGMAMGFKAADSKEYSKHLDGVFGIVTSLTSRAISQRYGVSKDYVKSLAGIGIGDGELGFGITDALLERKEGLDSKLKTKEITQKEWAAQMKAAVAEVVPKGWSNGIEEIQAFFMGTTVENLRTEAVYKKVKKE